MGIENKIKNKKNRFLLILLTFFFLLMCIGISTGASLYNYLSGFSKNLKKTPNKVEPYTVRNKNDPVNILVMGVDVGTVGAKEEDNHKRTDTIILINYDPKSSRANLISIPRDTLIIIKGKNQKINAANAIGGVAYLINAVESMLDVKINYFGKVDYSGFRELVDIIGGVDLKIPSRMDYDDPGQNLHIHFNKDDIVHLDGKKAEEFFRWRKNNDGTGLVDGDLGRIQNQHLFIEKVIDKFKSVAILPKIPDILQAIPKYAETNMDAESLLKYGSAILRIGKENITMQTLQGDLANIDGISYVIYDVKKNDKILSALYRTKGSENTYGFQKDKISVKILNGTGINGLAGSLSEELKNKGYIDVTSGNGSKTAKTTVTVYGVDKSLIDIIKNDLGITNIIYSEDKKEDYDVVVLLGDDYKSK